MEAARPVQHPHIKKDIKLSALLRTTYAIKRQFEDTSAPPSRPCVRASAGGGAEEEEEEEEEQEQEEESEKAAAILRVQHSR